ncbi:hypothetical protein IU418_26470 [Nocardia farcinica]|uniref:hypothetical protein n=1 Tax=Nocardia farcinica TaxID=37329 RepID=UPI001B3C710A|nr:hypothetical protein [Nocardia farcinica]MBF6540756.1 hypothetical protein [Nocardia farcinica]
MTAGKPRRRDADRRLTFTQSPGTAAYAAKLAAQTGLSRADLYNTAMRLVETVLPALVDDRGTGVRLILQDLEPGVRAVLGDILASIPRSQGRAAGGDNPDGSDEPALDC